MNCGFCGERMKRKEKLKIKSSLESEEDYSNSLIYEDCMHKIEQNLDKIKSQFAKLSHLKKMVQV